MKNKRWLAGAAALLLLCGAVAETADAGGLTPDAIYHLELRLSQLGYFSGESDGTFDEATRTAVESFQQANGLEVTGAADEATLAKLNGDEVVSRQVYLKGYAQRYAQQENLQSGSSGRDVQDVQRRLKELGFGNGKSDGVFGDATAQAVRLFQLANGLAETGVVDAGTRMRLFADSAITWEGFLTEMSAMPGDTGLNVSTLQKKLAAAGYFSGDCTGSYGELTQQAVARFQRENGLEETGRAGVEVWGKLFDADCVTLRRSDVLQRGDTGARVTAVQEKLIELGYLSGSAGGEFDFATEIAVRLCQLGAGELSTGVLDADGEQALLSGGISAVEEETVQQTFAQLMRMADEGTADAMAAAAEGLLGSCFGAESDELYPGFTFVQFVCAAANMPIQKPETLASMAAVPVIDAVEVQPGDLVALQGASEDSVSLLLAIGAGDGKLYYTTEDGGWVVVGFLDQMNSTKVYRWSARLVQQEAQ